MSSVSGKSKFSMKVEIVVTLRDGVLDPQGQAIQRALRKMGHSDVTGVRQGKVFELEFAGTDVEEARRESTRIAEEILSNPLIEKFEIRGIS